MNTLRTGVGLLCMLAWLAACRGEGSPQPAAAGGEPLPAAVTTRLYVQTSSELVYVDLDAASGKLVQRGSLQSEAGFSVVWIDSVQRRVYGLSADSLSIFAPDFASGTLQPLGRSAVGSSITDLWVHAGGRWAIVGHSPTPLDPMEPPELELFSVDADGALTVPATRLPDTTTATRIVADPSGRWVFGLACEHAAIAQYGFDAVSGKLGKNLPEPQDTAGADLVFHPNGKWAYITREQDVRQLLFDADSGRMRAGEFTLYDPPSDANAGLMSCWRSRIAVHPTGRFVYALTLFGGGSVFTYSVAKDTGRLTRVSRFSYERFRGATSLAVDRSGRYLFAGGGANVFHLFALDPDTGVPTFVEDVPGTAHGGTIAAVTAPRP